MKNKRSLTCVGLNFIFALLSLSMLFSYSVDASGKSEENDIIAIGAASIKGGNLALAKKKALDLALTKGMEDYLVGRMGREGMIVNFQRLVHEIIPEARQGVENFNILTEEQTDDTYIILVRLRINQKVVDEKLTRAGLVMLKDHAVELLFMVSEINQGRLRYWWKYPGELSAMGAIELSLHNAFLERGFYPVNRLQNIPESGLTMDMRALDLTDKATVTWGRLFNADVVIRGRTQIMAEESTSLMLEAIAVDTGKLICREEDHESIKRDSEGNLQISGALDRLANRLASDLTPVIIQAAESGREKVHILAVTLSRLKTYRQFMAFKTFLNNEVVGVKSVKQTRVKKDSISMEVGFEGDEDKFLDSILKHENLPLLLDGNRTQDGNILIEVQ